MSTINEKINDIAIKTYKGNNSSFAKAMGTSETNIRNYRKKTMPKLDFVVKLHQLFELNFEYLLSEKIDVGNTKIEDATQSLGDQSLQYKMVCLENDLLKDKLNFQAEQIEFYKSQIAFLTVQMDFKKSPQSEEIDEGLKIIDEIENISLKKSVK